MCVWVFDEVGEKHCIRRLLVTCTFGHPNIHTGLSQLFDIQCVCVCVCVCVYVASGKKGYPAAPL